MICKLCYLDVGAEQTLFEAFGEWNPAWVMLIFELGFGASGGERQLARVILMFDLGRSYLKHLIKNGILHDGFPRCLSWAEAV